MAIIWEHGSMTVSRMIPLIDGHLHFNTISTVVRELDRIGFLSQTMNPVHSFIIPKLLKTNIYQN